MLELLAEQAKLLRKLAEGGRTADKAREVCKISKRGRGGFGNFTDLTIWKLPLVGLPETLIIMNNAPIF